MKTDEAPVTRPASVSELDDIIYRISHDLRASVRALQQLPAWVVDDLDSEGIALPSEPARSLDLIQSHARRMDEMLNGLLEYSRVGRLQEMRMVSPQAVLDEVLAELQFGEGVEIRRRMRPVKLFIGEADMRRIFRILLSNAVRHHPTKTPKVEIVSCAADDLWELIVTDDGPGVPQHARETIFRPMSKLVSRDVDEGGGMGLAILKKIVGRYGGTVHVDGRSRGVSGASFRVRLPLTTV